MTQDEKTRFSGRIALIGVFFGLFVAFILLRAVHLQVLQRDFLTKKAESQYTREVKVSARRGVIYDARHRQLAVTLDVASISARPGKMEDKEKAAEALARALDLDTGEVLKKLTSGRTFLWVKRQASPAQAARVQAEKIPGIGIIPATRRFYPNKNLAGQVLGFCGVDGHGLEGLEHRFDKVLAGESTQWTTLKDALGNPFLEEGRDRVGQAGDNLILTLDRTIQTLAEDALAEAVESNGAKSGIAVVMEPKTGAILAMAHYPFMNPNDFGQSGPASWRNRAVTDTYEPGSTMKVFMAAAAVESGLVTGQDTFNCENGEFRLGRNVVHDVHPHGVLSLHDIVKFSSNIGAVKVGQRIGRRILYETLKDFGFGEKAGVDCPGEADGTLTNYEDWTDIDAGAIAFGQGVSISAVQLVTAVSAIANGGELMRPYLVQAVTDQRGRLVESVKPQVIRRVVSTETARIVSAMMADVVKNDGTAPRAALDGYVAAGKTGTAQKVSKSGGYAKGRYVASFVGFAPLEDPEVCIAVIVDEPKKSIYGGVVAGPAFKKIAEKTLQHKNIPPKRDANGQWTACALKGPLT